MRIGECGMVSSQLPIPKSAFRIPQSEKILRRNAVAVRFVRARSEKSGNLGAGVQVPAVNWLRRAEQGAGRVRGRRRKSVPCGSRIGSPKNRHRHHEHGRGKALTES